MIYIKEYEYEMIDIKNYQERYLKISSWSDYVRCITGSYAKVLPDIRVPENFNFKYLLQDCLNERIIGYFYVEHKGEIRYFTHISEVIDKKDIPYDVYIDEVSFGSN